MASLYPFPDHVIEDKFRDNVWLAEKILRQHSIQDAAEETTLID